VRLTKLGHACVRLEKAGLNLVIDPGIWSGPDALAGANAILITHEHVDHLDAAGVLAALAAEPGLRVWTNAAVAALLADAADRVHVVRHGDTFPAAGFDIGVYGHEHAVIHPDIPVIPNTGFVVDGEVFHPGDSLTIPEHPVSTLLRDDRLRPRGGAAARLRDPRRAAERQRPRPDAEPAESRGGSVGRGVHPARAGHHRRGLSS